MRKEEKSMNPSCLPTAGRPVCPVCRQAGEQAGMRVPCLPTGRHSKLLKYQ
jgi:hypothetical protein